MNFFRDTPNERVINRNLRALIRTCPSLNIHEQFFTEDGDDRGDVHKFYWILDDIYLYRAEGLDIAGILLNWEKVVKLINNMRDIELIALWPQQIVDREECRTYDCERHDDRDRDPSCTRYYGGRNQIISRLPEIRRRALKGRVIHELSGLPPSRGEEIKYNFPAPPGRMQKLLWNGEFRNFPGGSTYRSLLGSHSWLDNRSPVARNEPDENLRVWEEDDEKTFK